MNELNDYKDLQLTQHGFKTESSDRVYVDLKKVYPGGFGTVNGVENLAQAIVNRLMTQQGALEELGHPDYGSRLHELRGEANNLRLRVLTEVYIRECLAQESRIVEIKYINLAPPVRGLDRSVLKVTLGVLPIGTDETLRLELPLQI